MDLLAQVPDLPAGDVVDLGCGNGAVAEALAQLGRPVVGVDSSAEMLAEAKGYTRTEQADIATWQPEIPPALIFSNAALQWLGGHDRLMPRLAGLLAPGGVLAVQMPRQEGAPSHRFLRDIAARMFPDRFAPQAEPRCRPAQDYLSLLSDHGEVLAWETEYMQVMPASGEGHPVRRFTQGAAMLPFVEQMSEAEAGEFIASYDAALAAAYPLRGDGSVVFPFRRCFFVLTRPA